MTAITSLYFSFDEEDQWTEFPLEVTGKHDFGYNLRTTIDPTAVEFDSLESAAEYLRTLYPGARVSFLPSAEGLIEEGV